mgnify:CR=1 FL=1
MFNFENLISKYSKKLGLDLNYFLKGGFWTSLYLTIDLVLGFLFSIFLIKYLTSEELGLWYWLLSIFSIGSIFTLTGFNLISRKLFLEKSYGEYKRLFKTRFIFSLIGSLILFISSIHLYIINKPNIAIFFIIIGVLIPFSNNRFYGDYLLSKRNFKQVSIQAIIKYFSYYISSIILLLLKVDFIIVFCNFFIVQFLFDLYFTIKYFFKINNLEKLKKDKQTFNKGFQFSIIQILPTISSQIDKLLIPIFLTLKDLAIYGIAMIIPNIINGINRKLIFSILFEKINHLKIKDLKLALIKNSKRIIIIYCIYYLVLTTISIILFKFILKIENFNSVLIYSELLLSITFISIFVEFLKKILESRTEVKSLFKYEIQYNIILIILQIICIYFIGILGAILSKFLIECFKLILLYKKVQKIE